MTDAPIMIPATFLIESFLTTGQMAINATSPMCDALTNSTAPIGSLWCNQYSQSDEPETRMAMKEAQNAASFSHTDFGLTANYQPIRFLTVSLISKSLLSKLEIR